MTREQAEQIRDWLNQDTDDAGHIMTWRVMAELAHERYGDDLLPDFRPGWGGNQLAGMELEGLALSLLSEVNQ